MMQPAGLVRGLGLFAAMSINIANIIGTGVFLKARVMTCNVETPWAVLATWVAAGLLVTAGALCFAELGTMMPRAGGEFVFLTEAYGPRAGFLYGWSYTLIGRAASLAAQSVSSAIFLNIVLGGFLERHGAMSATSLAALAAATAVNCLSVATVGRFATTLTVVKSIIVAAVGIAVFLFARGDFGHWSMSGAAGACAGVAASARGGIGGWGAAMLGALWGFHGWANLAPMVGEVRDPERNIPRAFLGAVAVVGALYLLANASYFWALTPEEVASVPLSSSVATEAIRKFLGPAAASLIAMGMLISSLGALQAGAASGARVPFAMAREGRFFAVFGRVSAAGAPVNSAILVGCWSGVLALSGNYDKLTDWAIFGNWLFFGLSVASLFVFRRRNPQVRRSPIVPAVFLLVTLFLLVNTLVTTPVASLIGLGIIALGLPFYEYWSRKHP
jgi:APA family basic amino acid/polyamine antiporter